MNGLKLGLKLVFGRTLLWQDAERRHQLKVKERIRDFRDVLSHLQFAVEM